MASSPFLQGWCLFSILLVSAFAQLSENFYSTSCPEALSIIRNEATNVLKKDPSMGGSLLHLHFKDCGVGGCDASILLDDTESSSGEKSTAMNLYSTWGYEVIDSIKTRLENACPGVVSCADILTVVARDSIAQHGGPNYTVPLGRRDSTVAHRFLSEIVGAAFQLGSLKAQISMFEALGFSKTEFVALIGSHTMGKARCLAYRNHIYEDKNIDPTFAASMQAKCPKIGGDNSISPIDTTTPYVFDNAYFVNLMKRKGLLAIDQSLYTGKGGTTDAIVANYSSSSANFFTEYVTAIVKFGQLKVLSGTKGEIRTNCRKVNDANN